VSGQTIERDWDGVAAAAVNGDRAAMHALWHQHRRWVAAVLLAHKAQEDQLDDLLQDVAMALVRRIETLREAGNVRAWLRTVAVNAARASARARRARPRPDSLAAEPPGAPQGRDRSLDEEAQRVLALASGLPEAYREPLMLRAIHGVRGRHIASILGLSEATVETRIARARRMLRQLLDADGAGGVATTAAGERNDHEPVA
jgi:RNA polymerase sigma factor (sigma-70 family)